MSHLEIPLTLPDLSETERELVAAVLRSGRLERGPMAEELESAVAARAGVKHGVCVSSCGAGLFVLLRALGIGPGDEVVCSPLAAASVQDAVLAAGATAVFVDIEPVGLLMDPMLVERACGPRTKAILVSATLGNAAHFDGFAKLAARLEIPLLEDGREALGATLKGRRVGSFGRAAVFSLSEGQVATAGGGGVIVTDDDRLASVCLELRDREAHLCARSGETDAPQDPPAGPVTRVAAFGLGMGELEAAVGLGQVRRLSELLARRVAIADRYVQRLLGSQDLVLPNVHPDSTVTWASFVVRLDPAYTAEERDRIVRGMRNHEVRAAPGLRCRAAAAGGRCPIAESVAQRSIALPMHSWLSEREVDLVAQTLSLMISRENLARRG